MDNPRLAAALVAAMFVGATAQAQPYTIHSGPAAGGPKGSESLTVLIDQATGQAWFLAFVAGSTFQWVPLGYSDILAPIPTPPELPWGRDPIIGKPAP